MKRFQLILVLVLLPLATQAQSPTLVQHVTGPTANLQIGTYTLPLPNPTLSGNLLIVSVATDNPAPTVTVSDNKNNAYTPGPSGSGNENLQLWYATGSTAGVDTITVTISPATAYVQVVFSEFYNVTTSSAADGMCTGLSGLSTTVACSSAITTSSNGDLIYQVGWADGGVVPTSWNQGSSPWAFLSGGVDIASGSSIGGFAAQYQIQTTHGSITPSMTTAPSTQFDTMAIAFRAATAGTAPSAGIRIVSAYHAEESQVGNSPFVLQCPTTGNLIVVAWIGAPEIALTGVTDGNGNIYTLPGSDFNAAGGGDLRFAYAASATSSSTMTGPNLAFSGPNQGGSTAIIYDVIGAATSPYDTTAGNPTVTATDSGTGTHQVRTVSITPSTTNGLVFSEMGVNSNQVIGVTPGNFIAATDNNEGSSGDMDENNGWSAQYNTTTSQITYSYTITGGAASGWGAMAVAFEAAEGGGEGNPDFGLSITPGSQSTDTTNTGDPAQYTLTLKSINGFSDSVQLSCNASNGLPAGATCSLDGQSISSSTSPLAFTITTSDVAPATYTFSIEGASGALMHSASSQLVATPPAVSGSIVPPTSATVAVGSSAPFSFTVNSAGGFSGQEQVSFSCPNPPAGITCMFDDPQIMIDPNASQTSGLMIDVNSKPAAVPAVRPTTIGGGRYPVLLFVAPAWIGVTMVLLFLAGFSRNSLRRRSRRIASAALGAGGLLLLASLCSCSGGSGGGGGGGSGTVTVPVLVQATAGGTNTSLGTIEITVP